MALVVLFQLLYVGDCMFHEGALLSTWDIRHERFGWMLVWGSVVWVPFTFSLQAYYLVDHTPALSPGALAAIAALSIAGYVVFRGSNLQKHRFRLDLSPGMTGPMQVYGRGDLDFSERLEVEFDYVENVSLARDVSILFQTIPVVLRGNGAY